MRYPPFGRHYSAENFCRIGIAFLHKLEWTNIQQLVREGFLGTVVTECIIRDRPSTSYPGSMAAFSVQFLARAVTRTATEAKRGTANDAEVNEILVAIGKLRPYEAAMAALARGDTLKKIIPAHAFDFVNYSYAMALLALPEGSWEARETRPLLSATLPLHVHHSCSGASLAAIPASFDRGNAEGSYSAQLASCVEHAWQRDRASDRERGARLVGAARADWQRLSWSDDSIRAP